MERGGGHTWHFKGCSSRHTDRWNLQGFTSGDAVGHSRLLPANVDKTRLKSTIINEKTAADWFCMNMQPCTFVLPNQIIFSRSAWGGIIWWSQISISNHKMEGRRNLLRCHYAVPKPDSGYTFFSQRTSNNMKLCRQDWICGLRQWIGFLLNAQWGRSFTPMCILILSSKFPQLT